MTRLNQHMNRFRHLFPFAILLFLASGLMAQQVAPIGFWTPYVSYSNVVEIVKQDDILYTISQGGLFSYDIPNNEISSFSTTEGMSGVSPSTIYADSENDLVFIGYQNGAIDFFNETNNIRYITDIERSTLFPTKQIYQFFSRGEDLYIATDFGIVKYDIALGETRSSYTKIGTNDTGVPVLDLIIHKDTLWAGMGVEGLFYAPLSHPNLADPTAWSQESGFRGLPEGRTSMLAQTGDILYAIVEDTLFQKNDSVWLRSPINVQDFIYMSNNEDLLFTVARDIMTVIHPDSSVVIVDNDGAPNSCFAHDEFVWIGDRSGGLVRWDAGRFDLILPQGPKNNFVTQMAAGNGELYIAPLGRDGPSGRFFDQSGNSYFSSSTGWIINDERTNRLVNGTPHRDFCRTHYDKATRHCYMGSWGDGIVEMLDGDTVRSYTKGNSDIGGFSANDIRVSGLDMDADGNLWVSHVIAAGEEIINVKTTDDVWYKYKASSFLATDIIVDDFNNKWVISDEDGIIVFNENRTFDDTSDDDIRRLTTGEGNGGLPNLDILSGAKDKDGNIWLGTSEGVVVFYDPGSVFTTFFQDASCPIFSGRCLLKDQPVNTIAVDGANRKWIGTNDGVFLLSSDGTEQILRFTTENSPLLSNAITHIAIDGTTGEVFIGTSDGVISYMGDAIEGSETSETLEVFPNPVISPIEGTITIRGSVSNSMFKITTASGLLVREIESNGGQAVWDGRDLYGNLVASGVYLVMVADGDGEFPGIAKIAIINGQ